jgi:hypothetical protein
LASVGRERIEETIDPELAIDRALVTYLTLKRYTIPSKVFLFFIKPSHDNASWWRDKVPVPVSLPPEKKKPQHKGYWW